MEIQINTNGYQRRFIWTGRAMHYIDPKAPLSPNETEERRPAMCGTRPSWPAVWWGIDDSSEYFDADKGKELNDCPNCLARMFYMEVAAASERGELGVRTAE